MPELPEVQTVTTGLQPLVGAKIKNVILRFHTLRYPLVQAELDQAINQSVVSIVRRAKYIIIYLSDGGHLLLHLGMSGSITLLEKDSDLKKHDHVDIVFEDGRVLRYNDPRRFGLILYLKELKHPLLDNLGIEPLTDSFNAKHLYEKIQHRKTPIKQLIMDNAIVVGVGNIYACESLFASGISPLRAGCNVSLKECKVLVANIKQILLEAIEKGGSSLKDYKNAQGEMGYFQQSHQVYGRAKQLCKICQTPIEEVRLGQRNSFYCTRCQK